MVQIKTEQPHIPKQHSCALLTAELTKLRSWSPTINFHWTKISFKSLNVWIGTSSNTADDQIIHKSKIKPADRDKRDACFQSYIIFNHRLRTSPMSALQTQLLGTRKAPIFSETRYQTCNGTLKYAISAGNKATGVWGLYRIACFVTLQGSEKWK